MHSNKYIALATVDKDSGIILATSNFFSHNISGQSKIMRGAVGGMVWDRCCMWGAVRMVLCEGCCMWGAV